MISKMGDNEVETIFMVLLGTAFDFGTKYGKKSTKERESAKQIFMESVPMLIMQTYSWIEKGKENAE